MFQNHQSERETHQIEINKLQTMYEDLKQTNSGGAEKRCGSCDLPVMSCEHELFVPTVEWQQSQQELEQQIHSLQKVWAGFIVVSRC